MTKTRGVGPIRSGRLIVGACALAALVLAGCDSGTGGATRENIPPNVWLVSTPPEGAVTSYCVHLQWGGSDPDGTVAYYEYAVTDNGNGIFAPQDTVGADKWHKVVTEDSTFVFSADEPADSTVNGRAVFERSHTFFIRAVDNRGAPSIDPAYCSFTALTLAPESQILIPVYNGTTPALVPHIMTYRWRGIDYVSSVYEPQDPDSMRWILHPAPGGDYEGAIDFIRNNPQSDEWHPWVDYKAADDSGKSWTTPPTDDGYYVFAVQAKDEAGAVTPVFDERHNVRRIRVTAPDTGPLLSVYNEYIGTMQQSWASSPAVIVDLPAGLPLNFTWSADASSYGAVVTGYRYGWDIADLNDPSQWEIDYTPFTNQTATSPPRTFYLGVHTFDVEVIDNLGLTSRVEVKVNIVAFPMSRSVLVVDDSNLQSNGIGPTNGAVPSDAEQDAFWQSMVGDVAGFSPGIDAIQVTNRDDFSIVMLAQYKNVIWDAYGGYDITSTLRPKLWDLIHFRSADPIKNPVSGKVYPDLLSAFMRVGGHVMICGHQPLTQAITPALFGSGEKYPFIFRYDLEGRQDEQSYVGQIAEGRYAGETSFPYQDACLNVLDIAYLPSTRLRTEAANRCGVDDIHGNDPKTNGTRAALPLDSRFPQLDLRSEVAGPGKYYAPESRSLDAEIYNPPYFATCPYAEYNARQCFQPIYGNGCLDTGSALYNAPIAFWSLAYGDVVPEQGGGVAARSVFFGVEPYYFDPAQFKAAIDVVLFDEWGLTQTSDQ